MEGKRTLTRSVRRATGTTCTHLHGVQEWVYYNRFYGIKCVGMKNECKGNNNYMYIYTVNPLYIMVYDERIPTSIAIMREKHNLGTCEACACVGQPIHSSQYLGIQAWFEHTYKCGHMWLVPGGNLNCCILLICVCKIYFVLFVPSGHLAVS